MSRNREQAKRKAEEASMDEDVHPDDMPPLKLSCIDGDNADLLDEEGFFKGEDRVEFPPAKTTTISPPVTTEKKWDETMLSDEEMDESELDSNIAAVSAGGGIAFVPKKARRRLSLSQSSTETLDDSDRSAVMNFFGGSTAFSGVRGIPSATTGATAEPMEDSTHTVQPAYVNESRQFGSGANPDNPGGSSSTASPSFFCY